MAAARGGANRKSEPRSLANANGFGWIAIARLWSVGHGERDHQWAKTPNKHEHDQDIGPGRREDGGDALRPTDVGDARHHLE